LVDYTPDSSGPRLLGLIAERATETMRREASDFTSPGVSADGTPYLGPVTSDRRGLIQWVEVDKLLSEQARAALFQPAAP
jgi:chemotaxis-related protein WspB